MLKIVIIAIFLNLCFLPHKTEASGVADKLLSCKNIKDSAKRLSCYDAEISNLSPGKSETKDNCKIEDYTHQKTATIVIISGATTCESGKMHVRIYEKKTNKFVTSSTVYISGYTFKLMYQGAEPSQMSFKYVISEK